MNSAEITWKPIILVQITFYWTFQDKAHILTPTLFEKFLNIIPTHPRCIAHPIGPAPQVPRIRKLNQYFFLFTFSTDNCFPGFNHVKIYDEGGGGKGVEGEGGNLKSIVLMEIYKAFSFLNICGLLSQVSSILLLIKTM